MSFEENLEASKKKYSSRELCLSMSHSFNLKYLHYFQTPPLSIRIITSLTMSEKYSQCTSSSSKYSEAFKPTFSFLLSILENILFFRNRNNFIWSNEHSFLVAFQILVIYLPDISDCLSNNVTLKVKSFRSQVHVIIFFILIHLLCIRRTHPNAYFWTNLSFQQL